MLSFSHITEVLLKSKDKSTILVHIANYTTLSVILKKYLIIALKNTITFIQQPISYLKI